MIGSSPSCSLGDVRAACSSLDCGVLMLVVAWARASYVTIHASFRGFFSSRGLWNVCWAHGYACGVSLVLVAAVISAPSEVVGRLLAVMQQPLE
eukprot:scaffold6776_cov37-Cyclotella_meneghiniana.AAC.2